MAGILKRFSKDNSASIIPTFGLMMVPMLITVGAAVDYTMAAKNRSKMVNVADAAILAAAVAAKELPDLKDTQVVKAK
ncbi:MAG: pilus assembly protein TadG-related protein, partial [Pseudomonadota bacterium]